MLCEIIRRFGWAGAVVLALGSPRVCLGEPADSRLVIPPPPPAPSKWDNIELRVANFPHLKFDMGALVAYRLNWVQLGVDYRSGHPAWALARAPCLSMPVSVPVPYRLMPMPGIDMALRLDVPVATLGVGARPPVEVHLDMSVQLGPMLRALSPYLSLTWLRRRQEDDAHDASAHVP